MKILIVEDDVNSRVFLERVLLSQGYTVVSAANGVQAMEKANLSPPDLIISDIMMPEMDGFELCRRVKNDKRLQTIPFVFYTATYIEQKDEKLAMALGAARFLIKPMETEEFFKTIRGVIEEHQVGQIPVPDQLPADMTELDRMQVEVYAQKLEKKVRELEKEREALRESEGKYRTLIENVPQKIFTKDRQSVYISCNALFARDLGITPEEFAGKTDYDFFPKELADKFRADDKRIMESGETEGIEEEYIKDCKKVWVYTVKTPIRDKNDNTIGILGVFGDITERKRAEEEITRLNAELEHRVSERTAQLEASNKELEAFSYSVSHDLRAPVRAIDGFTEILLSEYGEKLDEEGKRICSVIISNSKKMGQLIDELLAFSRLGRTEMHVSPIDMKAMANSVYLELTTPEMRQRIDFHLGDLHNASGDSLLIRQVWMNLISNAIKFSSRRKHLIISITSGEENDQVVFCVKDNGAGFNMKYGNKLFGVFQRLHSEREFEGTGVGLAIVKRIVHRHGGRVLARGEVDKGAAFYFSIPKQIQKAE